jgi:curved DNA-binding protein CbpA
MRMAADPYRVLGISRGADAAQVKAAHRRLAKRHHPDAPGGDEARFVAVQEAYLLLSDPLRRREWDRRHAPGPVDARDRGTRASARAASARWTREDAGAYRRTRTARGTSGAGRRADGGPASASGPSTASGAASGGRDARTRRAAWSAEGVPWWEDFTPKGRAASTKRQAADRGRGPAAGETRITGDMDAFSRSSGAAWSSAARRHFRRDEATLPSRGAFRYRGTQVVTGAEARKLAEEEAAEQAAAAAALFRRAAPAQAERAPSQAFDHEPTPPSASDSSGTTDPPAPDPDPPVAASAVPPPAVAPSPGPALDRPPVPNQPGVPTRPRAHPGPTSSSGARPPSMVGPVAVGAVVATAVAAIPVVLGASAGAIDPAAPPAVGTLLVGALIGAVSGWLVARGRGHATR